VPVEKNSQPLRFYGSPELELELRRLADADGRKFSDYVRWVLELHVYGHRRTIGDNGTGPNQADSAL
jgi:hypothetical protein